MDIKKLNRIARFIIKKVQEESTENGFQLIVSYKHIEKEFDITINEDLIEEIAEELGFCEEVADVVTDDYGFDVVLYTGYAPNYDGGKYED